MKKHKEILDSSKLNIIILTSFFIALEAALLAYISSSFIEQFISIQYLGYVFVVAHLISTGIILSLTNFIVRFGRYNIFRFFFFIHLFSLVGLIFAKTVFVAIPLFVLYNISLFVIYVGLDIFTETFSCDGKTGEIKGKQLVIRNMAFVISPIISGYLLSSYGFSLIFTITAIVVFLGFMMFIRLKGDYGKKEIRVDFKKNVRKVFKNKNLLYIIIMALWLSVFFAIMVIYMPLHLLQIGLDWPQIGMIFTVMLLSFVIFQYPAGILADRKYGEKEMLMIGLFITGVTTFSIFFINVKTVWVWMLLMFVNRIGACLIEVMSESYFFKQIDCRDVYMINFFRLMRSVGYVITPIVASIVLIFYPLKYIFIFLGIFMISGLFIASKIKDTK